MKLDSNKEIWTSELFEEPMIIYVTKEKVVEIISKDYDQRFLYRTAFSFETETESFTSLDEKNKTHSEFLEDHDKHSARLKNLLEMRESVCNELVEKFKEKDDKLFNKLKEMVTRDFRVELLEAIEDLFVKKQQCQNNVFVINLSPDTPDIKAILSEVQQMQKSQKKSTDGEENFIKIDYGKFESSDSVDRFSSTMLENHASSLASSDVWFVKNPSAQCQKTARKECLNVNPANHNVIGFEDNFEPNIMPSESVSINMEITGDVPNLVPNSLIPMSACSSSHLLQNSPSMSPDKQNSQNATRVRF
jgi:hypothetical protein